MEKGGGNVGRGVRLVMEAAVRGGLPRLSRGLMDDRRADNYALRDYRDVGLVVGS